MRKNSSFSYLEMYNVPQCTTRMVFLSPLQMGFLLWVHALVPCAHIHPLFHDSDPKRTRNYQLEVYDDTICKTFKVHESVFFMFENMISNTNCPVRIG